MMTHHAVLRKVPDPTAYVMPPPSVDTEVYELRQDQIGIADVRTLIEQAHRRPGGETRYRQLLVVTNFITVEAQQAMLKVVEEPPETTQFVFVIPESLSLLDTLLSRFSLEVVPDQSYREDEFVLFHKQSLKERMTAIETAVKSKNHRWQGDIKCGLIEYLKRQDGQYSADELTALAYVATTLLTRGASNKYLLEHLALTLKARS